VPDEREIGEFGHAVERPVEHLVAADPIDRAVDAVVEAVESVGDVSERLR
jgi:hypothetical protein